MDRNTESLGTITTAAGENFEIELVDLRVPQEADWWGFTFISKHNSWGEVASKLVIKKSIAHSKDAARQFAKGDPFNELVSRLDQADSNGLPVFWPNMKAPWVLL